MPPGAITRGAAAAAETAGNTAPPNPVTNIIAYTGPSIATSAQEPTPADYVWI